MLVQITLLFFKSNRVYKIWNYLKNPNYINTIKTSAFFSFSEEKLNFRIKKKNIYTYIIYEA